MLQVRRAYFLGRYLVLAVTSVLLPLQCMRDVAWADNKSYPISPSESAAVVALSQPVVDAFTGALQYGLPIEVTPGRQKLQPNLSLSYRSMSDNGWLGIGWALEVGDIERTSRFGVNYASDDYAFRQDGSLQDLVAIGTEYRAKIESGFSRIRKLTAGDGNPYWEVTTKTGVKLLFGQIPASRQDDPNNATHIFKWCLDRVEDPNGNYMTLSYTKDQGQIYLDHIDYTGNASLATTNTIKFYLETRPDPQEDYTASFRVRTASRLKTIKVIANDQIVRAYKLVYTTSASAGYSALSEVHNYGSDVTLDSTGTILSGTDLKLVSTTYESNGAAQRFLTPTSWQDSMNVSGYSRYYGDFNADGKTDMMLAINDASSLRGYVSFSAGTGTFGSPISWTLSGSYAGYKQYMVDLSDDGTTDLVLAVNDASSWRGYSSRSNGDGTFTAPVSWTVPGNFTGYSQYSGDLCGTGKTDLILAVNDATGWRGTVLLSNGDGTLAAPVSWNITGNYSGYKLYVGDFNGDGKADLMLAINDGTSWRGYVAFSNGDGTFAAPVAWTLAGNFSSYDQFVADENGDGKIDLLLMTNDGTSWRGYTAFSKGDGIFATPVAWTLSGNFSGYSRTIGDFNGDGKADIVLSYGCSAPGTLDTR